MGKRLSDGAPSPEWIVVKLRLSMGAWRVLVLEEKPAACPSTLLGASTAPSVEGGPLGPQALLWSSKYPPPRGNVATQIHFREGRTAGLTLTVAFVKALNPFRP